MNEYGEMIDRYYDCNDKEPDLVSNSEVTPIKVSLGPKLNQNEIEELMQHIDKSLTSGLGYQAMKKQFGFK
jgi:hypothetical protein